MTYACPVCELAAHTYLQKLQRLQKEKFFCLTAIFLRRILTRELHVILKIPCVYDFIIKLRRQKAEVIYNQENANIFYVGHEKNIHRKCKRLKLGASQAYDRSTA
jgi:hypothetical protein